jgi:hypothetical protein
MPKGHTSDKSESQPAACARREAQFRVHAGL